MRDDVMGAFGDPQRTGKPVGGDLVEGKPTPLLARAVDAATPAQRAVLDLVGDPQLSPDDVARIQDVIVATGALAALEARIEALAAEAGAAIERAPVAAEARDRAPRPGRLRHPAHGVADARPAARLAKGAATARPAATA